MSCSTPACPPDTDGDNRWIDIHRKFLQECKTKDPDVIFIGDSILETLQLTETWDLYFAPMHSLNFSIRGDRIEHILWRLKNGELESVQPKIVVLHAGTHNVNNSAEEIVEGISTAIRLIRDKLPDTYIVFPTLLPRGATSNSLRSKNAEVNSLLKELYRGVPRTQIVSIDGGLVQADGSISHHDFFDFLNLTNSGAKKVFEPVHDLLQQIINEQENVVENLVEKDLTPTE